MELELRGRLIFPMRRPRAPSSRNIMIARRFVVSESMRGPPVLWGRFLLNVHHPPSLTLTCLR